MKAIVTGATGTVGMALLLELENRGIETLVLCRNGSKRNGNIKESRYIRKKECSLDKLSELELGDEKFDLFFHLAWDGTTGAQRNDMYLQNLNVRYTLDAVELAARVGCSVFLGAGSQAECGSFEGKISSNTPAFPENGYGMAKLCAGQMSRILCKERGMKHIWVRILSVYGPYDGERSLVAYAIAKLSKGERASFTAGEQLWDYIYSQDAAIALTDLALKGRSGEIYCIGSGKARALREYIEIIRDAVAPEAELGIGDIPYSEGQVMYLCADTHKLYEDIGFKPRFDFEEGIAKTIEWYGKEKGE